MKSKSIWIHILYKWPLAQLQVFQNSGSQMFTLRVKPCQPQSTLDCLVESVAIQKLACQVHWLTQCHALARKMAKGLQTVSAPCSWTHFTLLIVTLPLRQSHQFVLMSWKQLWMTYLSTLNSLRFLHAGLSLSDCSSWISRPDTTCQTSWLQAFYLISHST